MMKITNGNIICKSAAIPAACLLALAANVTASVVRVRKAPFPAKIVGRYKAELTANPITKEVIIGTAISGILIRHNRSNLEKPKLTPKSSYRTSNLLQIGPSVSNVYGNTNR